MKCVCVKCECVRMNVNRKITHYYIIDARALCKSADFERFVLWTHVDVESMELILAGTLCLYIMNGYSQMPDTKSTKADESVYAIRVITETLKRYFTLPYRSPHKIDHHKVSWVVVIITPYCVVLWCVDTCSHTHQIFLRIELYIFFFWMNRKWPNRTFFCGIALTNWRDPNIHFPKQQPNRNRKLEKMRLWNIEKEVEWSEWVMQIHNNARKCL